MNYERKYIQYNDLVFDGYEMLGDYDAPSISFKVTTHPRSFTHGSYAPFKRRTFLAEESSVSLTIWLKEKKLRCEDRPFYRSFVLSQLSQHGKLWAVQDNTLIWAYATVTSYGEMVEHYNGKLGIDVDFMLYEGVWHKADKQKTFLHPYDLCSFMDCFDYKEYQTCRDAELITVCCDCKQEIPRPENDPFCCDCDCNKVSKEMALCYHIDDLQEVYKPCSDFGFRVIYDCEAAEEFFGIAGQGICTEACHNGMLAGRIYSETDIPTQGISITLVGKMHNPYVEINGNGNWIKGDYDGTLRIMSSGDVYYENGCKCDDPLEPDVWKTDGMTFGWTVVPRYNRVVVNLGACCGKACAYFDIDNLTI